MIPASDGTTRLSLTWSQTANTCLDDISLYNAKITFKKAGTAVISLSIGFTAGGKQKFGVYYFLNNVSKMYYSPTPGTTDYGAYTISPFVMNVNANDVLEVMFSVSAQSQVSLLSGEDDDTRLIIQFIE